LGDAFACYRRTAEWSKKEPRTREEWFRAWKWIKPVFGDCAPRTARLEDVSRWREAVEDTVLREAHRCLKIWRRMWKVAAAMGYCIRAPTLRSACVTPPRLGAICNGPRARSCARPSALGAWATTGSLRSSRSRGTPTITRRRAGAARLAIWRAEQ